MSNTSNILYTAEIDLTNVAVGELEVLMERSQPGSTDNEDMIRNVIMTARQMIATGGLPI